MTVQQGRYRLYSVEGNRQRLDGGSMFGNAPKALWSRWTPADELNRIELACRAFLLVDQQRDRRILLESGVGAFFEPKLRERYGVFEAEHRLVENLGALGIEPAEIDVVVLSHLHFDHAGGLLTKWREGEKPALLFENARYVAGADAWQRAQKPHLRDRVSFVPELNELLAASGRLELVAEGGAHPLGADFTFSLSDGHTPGQLLTSLTTERGRVVFCGDLVPGTLWLNQAISMGYDRFPERLLDEKAELLQRCCQDGALLLFTHDAEIAAATVTKDRKGRFIAEQTHAKLDGWQL